MVAHLPFGSWPSPLSADAVTAAGPRVDGARFVGDEVWWGQTVPAEAGRTTVRARGADGAVRDILPAPWSARSRVHEYGGGSWTASVEGVLFFVDQRDQRVRRLDPGTSEPVALTPEDATARYGGLRWDAGRLLAVRERVAEGATSHDVVAIDPETGGATSLATGTDFVAQPALSPDGTRLAWIGWNHPDMPWERTVLRIGVLDGGRVTHVEDRTDGTSSALQPVWLDDDALLFADDATGRWNLRVLRPLASTAVPVAPADADTGGPLWVLGTRWFAPLEDGRIVAVRTNGADRLVVIDPGSDAVQELPATATANASIEDAAGTRVLVSGANAHTTGGLWLIDLDRAGVRAAQLVGADAIAPEWLPTPRPLTVEGPHGPVHSFLYPPTNPETAAPDDALPPYLVLVHGGPTSHVGGAASAKIAYFTSRGIGVLDVNYGGSTGYGRAYRERLRGQWGVVDVDDVAAAASALADRGIADPARIAIEGGSAGGWTVLAALTRTDVFAAGISRYGVGDARALAADTHDFESRYLDGLIGPLPEAEPLYLERSPLSRPEGFRVPVLLLQGAEDRVVPPAQAEAIRDALAARGIPHAYRLYEGEGHGFRRRETSIDALEAELAFLGRVFGFDTPGVAPIQLD